MFKRTLISIGLISAVACAGAAVALANPGGPPNPAVGEPDPGRNKNVGAFGALPTYPVRQRQAKRSSR